MIEGIIESKIRKYLDAAPVIIRLPHGREIVTGPQGARLEHAPIVRARAWLPLARILLRPKLALGEAFMDGDIVMERGEIFDLFGAGANYFQSQKRRGPVSRALAFVKSRIARANPRRRARQNVAHHYDLSVDLYRRFLDADLQYSCAYFRDPDMSLEEAQIAKKQHIAAKLLLAPGQRVLDIGCGWGGLGLSLAQAGVDVLGVTLSEEQLALANLRAEDAGLSEHAQFELRDYRDLGGAFDRIVSVGMFEHVGLHDYDCYFQSIARLLKDDGVALVHTIGNQAAPIPPNPFIAKYIFPGGYIPSLSEIMPAIERSGLMATDIEVLRLHYADTLREWRKRFMANREEIKALYDERFCRLWEYYLAGSEAAFRYGVNAVFQIQLAKRHDAAPLTRDYITDAERRTATTARDAMQGQRL